MKPEYWDRAKRALARNDVVLGAIIRSRPKVYLQRRGEPFLTLARAIVGQQISVKAAQSVWDKVLAVCPNVTPLEIVRWTAEMFLIFNLLRPDVFPLDDLGLQKAIRVNYFRGRVGTLARMRRLGESWQPWRSVATWYLWRSLDPL